MNKRKLVLAGLGIFLAGLLAGGLGMGAYVKYRFSPVRMDKVGPVDFFMERLDHSLRLTSGQAEAIRPIVKEVLDKVREVREPCIQAEEQLIQEGARRIQTYLDDNQKERFAKFMERAKKFRGRLFGPPPGGRGPVPPPPPPGDGPPPPPPGAPGAG
uniref:Periplasmic heavy metal sensor n=1 Tax=Fundidesulfovibrio putealis TaxID=270496 RepID=A0A7C4EIW4_9BACT